VYGLVTVWAAEGREIDQARRALRLRRLKVSDREDPFAAIIRCTADPAKADKRTRSKWSRVMRFAAMSKPDSEALDKFIRRAASMRVPLASRGALGEVFGREAQVKEAAVNHGFGGWAGVVPVGPIPVTCRMTSPSLAHAKCGIMGGSEKNVPAGNAISLLSSHCSPRP
jgi:hypothetical protein